jgi:3alpha(or 20beta)-hydroxysteroid dehydrogenase
MRNISLNGKVALVTGAARGIGAAIVEDFIARGAKVLATDVLTGLGEQSVAGFGDNAAFCPLDVTRPEQWDEAFEFAASRFGPVTILVNNAGIETTGFIAQYDEEAFRKLFDVNVYGTFLGLKKGLQHMSQADGGAGGAIVNLSSMAHLIQQPCFGPYGATKSAVDKLTKVAAVEAGALGAGVRVNCVYPGIIDTDMQTQLGEDLLGMGLFESAEVLEQYVLQRTPLRRRGTTEDVALAVAYLCSDYADFITGAGLPVDGGMAIG